MERQTFFGIFLQSGKEKKFTLAMPIEALFLVLAFVAVVSIGLAHACNKRQIQPIATPHQEMSISPDFAAIVTPTAFEATTSEIIIKPAPKKPKLKSNADLFSDSGGDKVYAYIKRFQKIALFEQNKYGIPASVKMAQGLLESQLGTSEMARNINNHFGIKCHAKNCAPGHCENYKDDTHKDFFRRFNNAWESWRAHSLLLQGDRYKELKGKDFRAYARGLKKAGYATDKKYADKIISLIVRYDLTRLDQGRLFD